MLQLLTTFCFAEYGTTNGLGVLGDSIRMCKYELHIPCVAVFEISRLLLLPCQCLTDMLLRAGAKIDPNLILFVFLPALLFESSFAMDFHQIKVCIYSALYEENLCHDSWRGLVIIWRSPYGT